MNFTDINTIAKLAGVPSEVKTDTLEARKDLLLLDLRNQDISSVTKDVLITEVTKIDHLINNLNNE